MSINSFFCRADGIKRHHDASGANFRRRFSEAVKCRKMEAAWNSCKQAIDYAEMPDVEKFPVVSEVLSVGKCVSERCQQAQRESEIGKKCDSISDDQLATLARYTDGLPLENYKDMFDVVPELVNIVTVTELDSNLFAEDCAVQSYSTSSCIFRSWRRPSRFLEAESNFLWICILSHRGRPIRISPHGGNRLFRPTRRRVP